MWYVGIFNDLKQVSASASTLFAVFARKATVIFSSIMGREGQPVHNCKSPPRVSSSFESSLSWKYKTRQKINTSSLNRSFAAQVMSIIYSRSDNFQEFPESAWYPHFVKLTYQGWGQAVGTLARVITTYSECVKNAAAGKPFAPVLFSTWGTWKNTLIWHCSMNLHVQQGCVLTIIMSMNLKIHSFQIQYYCTSGIQLI